MQTTGERCRYVLCLTTGLSEKRREEACRVDRTCEQRGASMLEVPGSIASDTGLLAKVRHVWIRE